jgi:hypothetical protein
MIEAEGMINNHAFAIILVDSRASHSYIDFQVVEILKIPRRKNGKYWLVQLATRANGILIELVKLGPMGMIGLSTKEDWNILPLGSYDC